jgi:hypothetical protein
MFQLFNTLKKEQKQAVTLKRGVLLATRKTEDHTIQLFQIDGFYVEIYTHKKDLKITTVNCFYTTDGLESYLDNIDISDIHIM